MYPFIVLGLTSWVSFSQWYFTENPTRKKRMRFGWSGDQVSNPFGSMEPWSSVNRICFAMRSWVAVLAGEVGSSLIFVTLFVSPNKWLDVMWGGKAFIEAWLDRRVLPGLRMPEIFRSSFAILLRLEGLIWRRSGDWRDVRVSAGRLFVCECERGKWSLQIFSVGYGFGVFWRCLCNHIQLQKWWFGWWLRIDMPSRNWVRFVDRIHVVENS